MDEASWNVFHDGLLIHTCGCIPGDLEMIVEIAYLCRYLPTQSDKLHIKLLDCQRFEYHPYQQAPTANATSFAALHLKLLSAGFENGCISIDCSDGGYGGKLVIQYRAASTTTVEGQLLKQTELESAAGRYWSDWRQSHDY